LKITRHKKIEQSVQDAISKDQYRAHNLREGSIDKFNDILQKNAEVTLTQDEIVDEATIIPEIRKKIEYEDNKGSYYYVVGSAVTRVLEKEENNNSREKPDPRIDKQILKEENVEINGLHKCQENIRSMLIQGNPSILDTVSPQLAKNYNQS
jgi:hypothetical protein